MLASITPLGERARHAKWPATAAVYVLGTVAGGAALAALAGLAGSVVLGSAALRLRVALVGVALAVGLAVELARGSVPGPRRQVNEQWLGRYRSWVYGLGFGVQLGAGVTTVVVTSAAYVVPVAAFASASWETGAAIGAVAGALRGATVLASGWITTPERLMRFHDRVRAWQRPVRAIVLLTQLAFAALAILLVLT